MKSIFSVAKLSSIVAMAAVAVGCSASADTSDVAANGEENVEATTQSIIVTNPTPDGGPTFVDIQGIGKGCKKDTWLSEISPDGQTFTILFSEYEARVAAGEKVADSNCQLTIRLRSPSGLSYSLADFFYQGEAYLDAKGMKATQTSSYYFQGNPIDQPRATSQISGPTNVDATGNAQVSNYQYQDTIGIADLVWSPCGVDRRLNIKTSINVTNNAASTGNGFINTTSIDGSSKLVLRFKLNWRTCPTP
jgi:hypothetical protein